MPFATIIFRLFVAIFLFLPVLWAEAQQAEPEKQEPVELLQASEFEMVMELGIETRYLRGNDTSKVIFKQGDMLMRCKEAIHFPDSNFVVAYGEIEVERGDSIRLYGDTLLYYGNERFAELRHRVRFTDQNVLVTAPYMSYDLIADVVSYSFGGTVTDPTTVLTSRKGYYHTPTKMVGFKGNVVLDNKKSDYHIETDTLAYQTVDKIAYFPTKAKIDSKDGHLNVNNGEYHSQQSRSYFKDGASVENEEYILEAQELEYDEIAEYGFGKGKVRIFDKKDSVTIFGDEGFFNGAQDLASVMGNALVEKPMSGDTLYLLADTLHSFTDSLETRTLLAYPNVRIFSKDLEGICDSLSYNTTDSIIRFFKDPVLWSGKSQMEADSISGYLREKGLDKLLLRQKSFVVSQDTLGMFNQMKGRNMVVWFLDGQLHQVDVNGNGESLYFGLEKDTVLLGANKVTCSNMVLRFTADALVKSITFIKNAEATFVPPHELTQEGTKLEGFVWRKKEHPKRSELTEHPHWPYDRVKKKVELPEKDLSAYGALIAEESGFKVFLTGDTLLTFYLETPTAEQVDGYFFADVIPRNQADLPDSVRAKAYQQLVLQPTAEELAAKPFVLRMSIPSYPKYTVRFGRYIFAFGAPNYRWSVAHNFYQTSQPKGKAVPQEIPEEYQKRRKAKKE